MAILTLALLQTILLMSSLLKLLVWWMFFLVVRKRVTIFGASSGAAGMLFFFFSSRRRHTRFDCDWSSDVCSSDLGAKRVIGELRRIADHVDKGKDPQSARRDRHKDDLAAAIGAPQFRRAPRTARSEERRVGKECRSRWSPDH